MPTKHLGRMQLGAIAGAALFGWAIVAALVAGLLHVLHAG